jgi:hypothetical protein
LQNSQFEDIPLFDHELIDEIIDRHNDCENYDDNLFHKINNHLMNTETFEKFKPLLFHHEFYGYSNVEGEHPDQEIQQEQSKKIYKHSQEQKKLLENPNIYLLNNDLLDELMVSLLEKLKKKYEVNDIYRDEDQDLRKFEQDERFKLKRRTEMENKAQELSKKYNGINLLYEKMPLTNNEDYKDLYEFRKEYGNEYEEKFDTKFKIDYRTVKPELKERRYFTKEDNEKIASEEDKIDKIKEKIQKEIDAIRLGEPIPTSDPVENEEDKLLEETLRQDMMLQTFGPENPENRFIPLHDSNKPVLDFDSYIAQFKRRHKKAPKVKFQDEIMNINRLYNRYNLIIANSIHQTKSIPIARQREIASRFNDLFGKYSKIIFPEGFRHYENFEIYNSLFPSKTVADYQGECK